MTAPRSLGPGEAPLPLFEIVHTARLADRAFTAAFAQHGLAAGQFGVLASVNDAPGITQAQIARRLNVRPQSVARPVDQLIHDGLICSDAPVGQGGATPLHITETGRDRLDQAWPTVITINHPDALGLGDADIQTLIHLLTTIRTHLEQRPL